MLCALKKSLIKSYHRNLNLSTTLPYNYFSTRLNEKLIEKYPLSTVETIINNILDQDYRDILKLPKEFHKFSDILITLEKPTEPDDWECCGKGCHNCCWEVYESKVKNFEETIKLLHEKVNEN